MIIQIYFVYLPYSSILFRLTNTNYSCNTRNWVEMIVLALLINNRIIADEVLHFQIVPFSVASTHMALNISAPKYF